MSSFNWHFIFFNLTVLHFHAWTETIILAANNLFSFIFTSGFGDSSIFRIFRRRDLVSSLTNSYVHVLPSVPRRSEWYFILTLCLNMSVLVLNVCGMSFILNISNWLIKLHTSCWKFPIPFEIKCMELFTYFMTFWEPPNTSIYLTFLLIAFQSPWIKVSYSVIVSVHPGSNWITK